MPTPGGRWSSCRDHVSGGRQRLAILMSSMDRAQQAVVTTGGVQALFDTLKQRGYRVIGPILRDGAILYDDIASVGDLPKGWTDEQ
jgi:hypothetical protein